MSDGNVSVLEAVNAVAAVAHHVEAGVAALADTVEIVLH